MQPTQGLGLGRRGRLGAPREGLGWEDVRGPGPVPVSVDCLTNPLVLRPPTRRLRTHLYVCTCEYGRRSVLLASDVHPSPPTTIRNWSHTQVKQKLDHDPSPQPLPHSVGPQEPPNLRTLGRPKNTETRSQRGRVSNPSSLTVEGSQGYTHCV